MARAGVLSLHPWEPCHFTVKKDTGAVATLLIVWWDTQRARTLRLAARSLSQKKLLFLLRGCTNCLSWNWMLQGAQEGLQKQFSASWKRVLSSCSHNLDFKTTGEKPEKVISEENSYAVDLYSFGTKAYLFILHLIWNDFGSWQVWEKTSECITSLSKVWGNPDLSTWTSCPSRQTGEKNSGKWVPT